MASPLTQIKEIWNRLPVSGRIATVGSAVATLGLLAAIIYYGTQPEYGILFSDMKPADAQAIVEKLKTENVPYSLSAGGTSVSVPNERIAELRLQMASTGVLSGGHVGFDLFDKTSFGATDFAQQINYRRAIEGELAKTLEGVDEVESARVHITPKKESIFSEKEEGAKASVMLRIRQGKALSSERTEAVVSLISSAVEGLDPSNVSVMDTNGRLLSSGGGSKNGRFGDAGAFQSRLEAKQKFEAENTSRIIALLEPVVGEGRIRANVSADLDFSETEQTEEKYNPQSQVIRSQQTSQEARSTTAPAQNNAVGARSNDPTAPPPAPAQNNQRGNNDQRNATTTNYEIDRTVKKTVGSGGQVNRLTVSVVVDSKIVNGVETARQPEELQKIQDLVAAAIGTKSERGDSVVVQTMAFDKPSADADAPTASFFERYKQFVPSAIKYGTLVVLTLLLFLFVIRPARRNLRVAFAAPNGAKQLGTGTGKSSSERRMTDEELAAQWDSAGMNPGENSNSLQSAPMMTVAELEAKMQAEVASATPPLSKEAQRAQTVRKIVAEETMTNPDTVASTLRTWLQEN